MIIFYIFLLFRCNKEEEDPANDLDTSQAFNPICDPSHADCFEDPYLSGNKDDGFSQAIEEHLLPADWVKMGMNAQAVYFKPSAIKNRVFLCGKRLSHAFFKFSSKGKGKTRAHILSNKIAANSWGITRGPRGQFWIVFRESDNMTYYSYQQGPDGPWATKVSLDLESTGDLVAKIMDSTTVRFVLDVTNTDEASFKSKFQGHSVDDIKKSQEASTEVSSEGKTAKEIREEENMTKKERKKEAEKIAALNLGSKVLVAIDFDLKRNSKYILLNAPNGTALSESEQKTILAQYHKDKEYSKNYIKIAQYRGENVGSKGNIEIWVRETLQRGSVYSIKDSQGRESVLSHFSNNICP